MYKTVGHRNIEYDAAQALLDLQGPTHTELEENNASRVWSKSENTKETEHSAKLIWNCFISSEASPPVTKIRPNVPPQFHNQSPQSSKTLPQVNKKKLQPKTNCEVTTDIASKKPIKRSFSEFESEFKLSSKLTLTNDHHSAIKRSKPRTRSVGTQTDGSICDLIIVKWMETTIRNHCEKIKLLEAEIKAYSESKSHSDRPCEESSSEDGLGDPEYEMTMHTNSGFNKRRHSAPKPSKLTKSFLNTSASVQEKGNNKVLTNHNVNPKSIDKVPIGDGHATVPSRLLKHINWNSYSSATRKLLTAVFSRRVLATHSLTGKPSPAFPNKPLKKRLDPDLVNDIVQTVVERCSVPESVVRTSITTKCADESKMLRTRQKNNKKRPNKKNRENNPPGSSDSGSDD